MKRMISTMAMLLLVVAMVFTVGVTEVSAAIVDGVDYSYTVQDGNLYITYISGDVTDLVIPAELDGMPVYGISDIGWNLRYRIRSITLPDSVQVIGEGALQWTESMETIHIGAGVKYVYRSLFYGCDSLKNITISENNPYFCAVDGVVYDKDMTTLVYCPSSKTSLTVPATVSNIDALLESPSFMEMDVKFAEDSKYFVTVDGMTYTSDMTRLLKCSQDKAGQVTLPETVTQFGTGAFAGCDKITSVNIPEGVTELTYGQFANCSSLQSISIPTSLESAGEYAFADCTALERVEISDTSRWCGVMFADPYANPLYYANNLYLQGALVENLEIPKGVQTLGQYTFINAECLKSVTMPEGLDTVGYNAFQGCSNLTSVSLPQSLMQIYGDAFEGCVNLQSIQLPQKLEYIEYNAFRNTGLTAITFPESLKGIGGNAFANTKLTQVEIPGDLEMLGGQAFAYTPLEKVTLREGLVVIPYGLFYNCNRLEKITLPESVTEIGWSAFYGCTALTTVELPTDPVYIGGDAFYGCPLKNVELSKTTETIHEYSFYGSGITEITLPESVTCISYRAFADCDKLQSITIPKNVTEIMGGFVDCDSLTGIWVDEENTHFSSDDKGVLFDKDKTHLMQMPGAYAGSYTVPETVYTLSTYAFANCDQLTQVVMPAKLRNVQGGATFEDCDNLTNVVLNGTIDYIPDSMFAGCEKLTSVTIPSSVTAIWWDAFNGCTGLKDIYFQGSPAQWSAIHVDEWGNEALKNVTVHYCGFDYTVQDGYAYITGAYFDDEQAENIVIPAQINGLEVRGVPELNWEAKAVMKTLTLPDTVTSIGWGVIAWSDVLEAVHFGENFVDIEQSLFMCCSNLKYVTVPENHPTLTCVDGVIYDKALTTMVACPEGRKTAVTVPKTVTNIDVLPMGVPVVFEEGSENFITVDGITYTADMTKLISCSPDKTGEVIIPDTVTSLQSGSFVGCTKITAVTVPSTVTQMAYQFIGCTSLKSITLPDTIQHIDMYSFEDCTALERVNIPTLEGWLGISFSCQKDNPLYYAGNLYVGGQLLTDLVVPETGVNWYAFYNADCLQSVTFHDNAVMDYESFAQCSNLKSVTLGKNMVAISNRAFAGCTALKTITLHEGLKEIWGKAFAGSGLTEITIPASVTEMGEQVFADCKSLKSVKWGTMTYVPTSTFAGCTALTDVDLPDTVQTIGEEAFYGCPLENFKLPATMTYVSDYAFRGAAMTQFTLPETVTDLGYKAFYNCDSLLSITIPKNVTQLWGSTFANCDNLTAIEVEADNPSFSSKDGVLFDKDMLNLIQAPGAITGTYTVPDGVEYLYGDSFDNCDRLYGINFNTAKDVGGATFRNCSNLRSVKLPQGMEFLAMHAFAGCSKLNSVQIPVSLTTIGIYAFDGCDSLTDIFYEGTEEQWNQVLICEGNDLLSKATVHFTQQLPAPGNFNGDDTITDADAMYLLRHTLFGNRYKLIGNGNVNGDAALDDNDAMYLLRFTLFGESRYPLH